MDSDSTYKQWLNTPGIDEETRNELLAIAGDENEITDRFFRNLEFGTAGLRGIMGAGTNRMNRYTVARATKGLADYIISREEGKRGVAIAFDSRKMSREFAGVAAAVLNARGITTYVFDALRPTPQLSFAIRSLNCVSGINITASHNEAKYNGYKVYWEDGAQVTSPHDVGIMECVNAVTDFTDIPQMDREEAERKGLHITLGKEMDEAYTLAILDQIREEDIIEEMADDLNIVYTPLHGTGITIVPGALERAGFKNIHIVKEQQVPDGDFPTVKFPNPELPEAFVLANKLAEEVEADIVIATDPDADRIGVRVRDRDGQYHSLDGNITGCLMCEYLLSVCAARGGIPKDGYIIRTIVSTRMVDAIAENFGVDVVSVPTGFKYIGRAIKAAHEQGTGTFLFGFEESYGYMTGDYVRDKDACGATLVLCEMCAYYKSFGLTLWDAVGALYEKYGHYSEYNFSIVKEGRDGVLEMQEDMAKLRTEPPTVFGTQKVIAVTDYEKPELTGIEKTNVLIFDMDCGWLAVRPSGTEPKIKYYMGVKAPSKEAAEELIGEIRDGLKRYI
ncbi:MAG: phospho-sugar mutase [Lachnospiraceae bacterium]|jgi:phosphoglucomutase